MPGRRLASMDLPVPGAPMSSTLCPPAAASTMARRASGWPITSAKSGAAFQPEAGSKGMGAAGGEGHKAPQRIHDLPGCAGGIDLHRVAARLGGFGGVFGGYIQAADAVCCRRQRHGQHARNRAQAAVQCQLPRKAASAGGSSIWPEDASTASSRGRSYTGPLLRMSAGARLTVMWRSGHL